MSEVRVGTARSDHKTAEQVLLPRLNLKGSKYFYLENGSSQGHNLALAALCEPCSFGSGSMHQTAEQVTPDCTLQPPTPDSYSPAPTSLPPTPNPHPQTLHLEPHTRNPQPVRGHRPILPTARGPPVPRSLPLPPNPEGLGARYIYIYIGFRVWG